MIKEISAPTCAGNDTLLVPGRFPDVILGMDALLASVGEGPRQELLNWLAGDAFSRPKDAFALEGTIKPKFESLN